MGEEILVVYKKNFEEVHDRSLEEVRSVMDALVAERGANVGYTARETVRRADFSGPDLVIVLGGDGTLTSIVCLLYTSPSPRDRQKSRMPSSA